MLQTRCENCIFNKNHLSCDIDIPVSLDLNDKQYTNGYCKSKRDNRWLNKINNNSSKEFLLRTINKEEAKLSVIIISLDNDLDKIKVTLKSMEYNKSFIKQIIVVVNNINDNLLLNTLKEVEDFGVKWDLENLQGTDYTFHDTCDYVLPLVNNHWLTTVDAGFEFDDRDLNTVHDILEFTNSNYVMFYNDNFFITNTFVFVELGGNYNLPLDQKIKSFLDWEQVCRDLSQE